MWPPSSPYAWFARTTMASAFQRTMEATRSSMAKSPGNTGWSCTATVFTYGVFRSGCQPIRCARATRTSSCSMCRARSGPSVATRARKASRHSAVSWGSVSARASWVWSRWEGKGAFIGAHSRRICKKCDAESRKLAIYSSTIFHQKPILQHMKLDTTDLRILAELQADGSLSNVELARRVHLSPSPCLARVKALETEGVIARYVALADFEQRIAEHDEVMECYLMSGDSDYLIRVALPDIAALERFIVEQLSPIPGLEKIRSSFALKQVRYKTALPLPQSSP